MITDSSKSITWMTGMKRINTLKLVKLLQSRERTTLGPYRQALGHVTLYSELCILVLLAHDIPSAPGIDTINLSKFKIMLSTEIDFFVNGDRKSRCLGIIPASPV